MGPGKENEGTDDVAGAARAAAEAEADDGPDQPLDQDEDEEAGIDGAPISQPPPPKRVADLAEACIRFVGARYGAALDFSSDTLSFVDQWVRDAREELPHRPEVADVVQAAAGAYLGEVIRLTFGGTWIGADDDGPTVAEWRLGLTAVYCVFNPIGMVREALLLETADGWHGHLELDPGERDEVEQRLAALPEIEPDEYYAPSTRFDVVSIVVGVLRAAMKARGLAGVRFAAEDYA